MRISTNTIYESGLARMTDSQAKLLKTQQQVASGKRILTPADDPVGAARVLNLKQGQELNSQYAVNRQNARNSLSLEESVLQKATSVIQDVKALVIQAGNPSYDSNQLKYIAVDLQMHFDELVGIANTRDGMGNYLFSGYQLTTQAYVPTPEGAQFNGDQGKTLMQVDTARQMAINESGDQIFDNISSAGTFVSGVAASNTGTGAVSRLSVVDAQQLTGHQYDIVFSDDGAGGLNYSVYDITLDPAKAGVPVAAASYVSPQDIAFDGLQVTASGAPANGDMMTIRPNEKQSLFTTLKDVINLLQTKVPGTIGGANLTHGLGIANNNFDSALDNVLSTRASIGSRLKELDNLDDAGEARNEQYAAAISYIEDVDYNKALSDLTKNQIILEAAQKSFAKITGLSLFNLL
jgi:flagellar hook-associated protein 3 FlgL